MASTPASGPGSPGKWWQRKVSVLPVWGWMAVGLLGIGVIGAAAGGNKDAATVAPVSTNVPVETSAPATAPTTAVAVSATLAPTTLPPTTLPATTAAPLTVPATTDGGLNPFGGNSPEDALMPDVMCMNLQEAQNEIQDHGVFFSRSEDATGQSRNQIIDSNWQVVGQSPEAGTPIGEFEAVLFVVKYGEPSPCG